MCCVLVLLLLSLIGTFAKLYMFVHRTREFSAIRASSKNCAQGRVVDPKTEARGGDMVNGRREAKKTGNRVWDCVRKDNMYPVCIFKIMPHCSITFISCICSYNVVIEWMCWRAEWEILCKCVLVCVCLCVYLYCVADIVCNIWHRESHSFSILWKVCTQDCIYSFT